MLQHYCIFYFVYIISCLFLKSCNLGKNLKNMVFYLQEFRSQDIYVNLKVSLVFYSL